jgi:hypothetical protein
MIGRITFTGDTFELKIYVQIYKQTRTVKLRPFHPSVDIVAFQKFLDVIEVIVVCEKIIFSDPMHGTILLWKLKIMLFLVSKSSKNFFLSIYIVHFFKTYHQKIIAFFSPFCLLLFCCFCYNYSCSPTTHYQHTKSTCKCELNNGLMIIVTPNYRKLCIQIYMCVIVVNKCWSRQTKSVNLNVLQPHCALW